MIQVALIAAILVIGCLVAFLVQRRPEFFWPLFIGLPLLASGFMVSGYAVVDEYFMLSVLGGGLLAAYRGLVPLRTRENTPLPFHFWLFLFTIAYLVLESVRGMILLGDVRVLRWVGYYLLFGVFLLATWRWQFPLPSVSSVARITGLASSVYFGGYLLLGLVNECVRGVARWGLQGVVWAGSSYAIFPLIFSFPAALFLLKSDNRSAQRLGWLTLVMSLLAVGYYESRVGWLVILGMLFFVPLVLGLRRALVVVPGLLIISTLALLWALGVFATPYCHTFLTGKETPAQASERLFDPERYGPRLAYFGRGIAETVVDPVTPRISDVDRVLHLKAAFLTATETPLRLFFGGGTHSHRGLLRPHLEQLYRAEFPGVEVSPVLHTLGLSAIAVDFGLIGLILIALNLLFVIKAITLRWWLEWRRVSILLFAMILIPFWLLVSNIQDMVIYFSLLMPENIFTFLLRVP